MIALFDAERAADRAYLRAERAVARAVARALKRGAHVSHLAFFVDRVAK